VIASEQVQLFTPGTCGRTCVAQFLSQTKCSQERWLICPKGSVRSVISAFGRRLNKPRRPPQAPKATARRRKSTSPVPRHDRVAAHVPGALRLLPPVQPKAHLMHDLTLSAGSAGQALPLIRIRRMPPRAAVRLEYQSSDIVAPDVPVLLYRQVNNLCGSVSRSAASRCPGGSARSELRLHRSRQERNVTGAHCYGLLD
jgi:hypothetical protein